MNQPQLIGAAPTQVPVLPEIVPIVNTDQFAQILAAWHADRIKKIKQLLEVPEGTTFTVGEEEVVLSGSTLASFKFGLEMALMQIGDLPFVAELEDVAIEAVVEQIVAEDAATG